MLLKATSEERDLSVVLHQHSLLQKNEVGFVKKGQTIYDMLQ